MKWSYEELLSRLTDMRMLARPAMSGERSGCCSSYDRSSKYDAQQDRYIDWGANDDGTGCVRELPDGSIVAAELEGPGVIWRSWSARALTGAIRVYVDGECVIDRPFIDYFTKFDASAVPANTPSLCPQCSRGYNSFLPIPFNRSLRIELAPGWGKYFHFTYTLFPKEVELPRYDEAFSIRGRILLAKLDRALYRRGERQGGSVTARSFTLGIGEEQCVLEENGSGAIARMELSLGEDAMWLSDQLLLRIYWDGSNRPSVSAPVSDFFACTPGAGDFRTWVCGKRGDTLYANWYMPFATGARVVLINRSGQPVSLSAGFAVEECPDARELMRFCAYSHGDDAQVFGDPAFQPDGERWPDWPVLRTRGAGRFCGMHLLVRNTFGYPGGRTEEDWWFGLNGEGELDWWWGEGDEKFFVDGEKFPSTFGTGSEDYIGYAWAALPPFALFDAPFAAMSDMPLDGNGLTSVCRFHVCDNVPFERAFEAYIEKYRGNTWGKDGTCEYTVVPYWYQMEEEDIYGL